MSDILRKIRSFLSPSGSFSRVELLIATVIPIFVMNQLGIATQTHPRIITAEVFLILILLLYVLWGVAVGKRSRDLGTTFTYGMVIGMVFPVMGLVFLFQPGKKSQTAKSAKPVADSAP